MKTKAEAKHDIFCAALSGLCANPNLVPGMTAADLVRMACRAVHDAEQAGALPQISLTTLNESKTPPDGWKEL